MGDKLEDLFPRPPRERLQVGDQVAGHWVYSISSDGTASLASGRTLAVLLGKAYDRNDDLRSQLERVKTLNGDPDAQWDCPQCGIRCVGTDPRIGRKLESKCSGCSKLPPDDNLGKLQRLLDYWLKRPAEVGPDYLPGLIGLADFLEMRGRK